MVLGKMQVVIIAVGQSVAVGTAAHVPPCALGLWVSSSGPAFNAA